MSYQFNQQPNLPYPIDRLVHQMLHVQPGRPPFGVPHNWPLPQQLVQFAPFIMTACIDAVQAKSQTNILRTFLFNLLAENGFNNPNFMKLAELTSSMFEMRLTQNAYARSEDAIIACAALSTEFLAAVNVTNYPNLVGYLDQNMQRSVQTILQAFQTTMQEITAFSRQRQQPQMPRNHGYGMGAPQQPMQNANVFQPIGQVSPFTNNQQMMPVQPPVDNIGARYAHLAQTVPSQHPDNLRNAVGLSQTPFIKPPEPAFVEEVTWQPSDDYLFNIAFDPNTSDVVYATESGNALKPYIKQKKAEQMNREDHLVNPSFSKAGPEISSKVRPQEKIVAQLEEPPAIDSIAENEDYKLSMSLDELFHISEMAFTLANAKNSKVKVSSILAILTSPMISLRDTREVVNHLLVGRTFTQVSGKLKQARRDQTFESITEKDFFLINKRLTDRYNEFLKTELAVPNGSIDSFVDDVMDSVKFIEERYGSVFVDALMKNQEKIIDQAISYVQEETEQAQNNIYADAGQEMPDGFNVCHFFSNYTISTTSLFSKELRVDVPTDKVSVAVFQNQTKILYLLAKQGMDHQELSGENFRAHLLRTADGVTFHITRSAINPEIYLVNVH